VYSDKGENEKQMKRKKKSAARHSIQRRDREKEEVVES
jgi:hypothetical protein